MSKRTGPQADFIAIRQRAHNHSDPRFDNWTMLLSARVGNKLLHTRTPFLANIDPYRFSPNVSAKRLIRALRRMASLIEKEIEK